MLTRDEFGLAVSHFLRELSGACLVQNQASLARLDGFLEELREALKTFRVDAVQEQVVLSTAFGLIDEFVSRTWDEHLNEAYSSYVAETAGLRRSLREE